LAPLVTRGIVESGLAGEESLTSRPEWYHTLIDLLKVRARTVDDIVRQSKPYVTDALEMDPEAVAKQWEDRDATRDVLTAIRGALGSSPAWDASSLEEGLRSLAESRGVGAGKLFQPLRVALTGMTASPGIFDVLVLLGRERSLARIDSAVMYLT
jgi:glutamyl-tRNA synthetase